MSGSGEAQQIKNTAKDMIEALRQCIHIIKDSQLTEEVSVPSNSPSPSPAPLTPVLNVTGSLNTAEKGAGKQGEEPSPSVEKKQQQQQQHPAENVENTSEQRWVGR